MFRRSWRRIVIIFTVAMALLAVFVAPGYPAARPIVAARNGMVVSANPLASQAGLQMLMKGGNAIDAAVATAAVLAVVEPQYSSIAAGGMMLIYDAEKKEVVGINANAPCPSGATPDKFPKFDNPFRIIPARSAFFS